MSPKGDIRGLRGGRLLAPPAVKGLMTRGSKCHQNNSPVVWDGYMNYEEAEIDRLTVILRTNNCGGGPCGIQ